MKATRVHITVEANGKIYLFEEEILPSDDLDRWIGKINDGIQGTLNDLSLEMIDNGIVMENEE